VHDASAPSTEATEDEPAAADRQLAAAAGVEPGSGVGVAVGSAVGPGVGVGAGTVVGVAVGADGGTVAGGVVVTGTDWVAAGTVYPAPGLDGGGGWAPGSPAPGALAPIRGTVPGRVTAPSWTVGELARPCDGGVDEGAGASGMPGMSGGMADMPVLCCTMCWTLASWGPPTVSAMIAVAAQALTAAAAQAFPSRACRALP
jgi:hypothetical protein